ncbi:MAG TPA: histidine kinase dimerization/phospho-acceptor domain-containing protein [Thermoanaerobaculia bacterium]|nr:histidine kinase dimerization/phospho-acceptor domain-containing protein [Thermoanaerobaculia bacterium]
MIPAILLDNDLLAAAPVAMFRADADGFFVDANARWNALIGDGWIPAIHPDDRELWKAAVAEKQRDIDLRFRIVRPDGAIRVVHVRASAFAAGWIGVADDVTERQQISHQLRTPLTSIRGALGLLASGAMGELNDDARELVRIAERNCIRLIDEVAG